LGTGVVVVAVHTCGKAAATRTAQEERATAAATCGFAHLRLALLGGVAKRAGATVVIAQAVHTLVLAQIADSRTVLARRTGSVDHTLAGQTGFARAAVTVLQAVDTNRLSLAADLGCRFAIHVRLAGHGRLALLRHTGLAWVAVTGLQTRHTDPAG
jgi:hypothetical protein